MKVKLSIDATRKESRIKSRKQKKQTQKGAGKAVRRYVEAKRVPCRHKKETATKTNGGGIREESAVRVMLCIAKQGEVSEVERERRGPPDHCLHMRKKYTRVEASSNKLERVLKGEECSQPWRKVKKYNRQ